MKFGWTDTVYRADLADIGNKLFEAAVSRDRITENQMIIVLVMAGMIIIPCCVMIVKRYLKNASSKQRSKDLESGESAPPTWRRRPMPEHIPMATMAQVPRIDQAFPAPPPLAVHHSVSMARPQERAVSNEVNTNGSGT